MAVLTSNYPTSLDTTSTLGEVANRAKSTLAVALASSGETQISLANASGFPDSGALTIDNEIFYYSSKSGNVLTIESRSQQGTTGAAHLVGALVYLRLTKGHWEGIRSSIIALQTKLGVGASTPSTTGHILGINGSGQTVWGTPASFGISGGSVSDATYSSSWNADTTNAPSKNAIYDRLQVLHNYVVVEDHASFAAALSYIATNYSGVDVELRIGSTVAVTVDTVVPSNVYISFNGSGKFNISAGVTLEIRAIINPGLRKLNIGAGKMAITRNGEVWAAWWCGKVTDNNPQYVDITPVMWDGMISSGYGGVMIRFTEGRFRVNFTLGVMRKQWSGSAWVDSGLVASGLTIKGSGATSDVQYFVETATNYFGTVIQGITDGIAVLETISTLNCFTLEDITFYVSPTFTGQAVLDIAGHVVTQIQINRCTFQNGDIGARLKSYPSVPNGNYIIDINFNMCNFSYNKVAGFKSETVNNSLLFNMCAFHPKAVNGGVSNAYGAWLYYTGTTKFVACTFEGYNINERAIHTPVTAHNSSTGLTTITAHGATVGTVEPVIIRNHQIETNTVVGTVTASGNAQAVVTYAGSNPSWQFAGDTANTPTVTVTFAVTNGDTASTVATKARAALAASPHIAQSFGVGGTGADVVLTVIAGEQLLLNDPDWNLQIKNAPTGGSTGITTTNSVATAATTANLPTGYTDKTIIYFSPVDANTGYFYAHPTHVGNTTLRLKWASLGSNNIMRTQIPRRTGIAYSDAVPVGPPLAAIKVEQQYFQIDIDNCQDEGFIYSLVVDNTFENRRPIRISNTTMQSPIVLNSTCYVLSNACVFPNMVYKDKFGMNPVATVESVGDEVMVASLNSLMDFGRTVQGKISMSSFVGGSLMRREDSKQVGFVNRGNYKINLPTGTASTTPALEIGRYQDDASTALLIRMGGRSELSDGAEYYYDITRINDPTPSSLLVPATQGYLGISSFSGTTQYDGLFVKGHLASYGAEYNAKQVNLANSGTVSVDCSLASKFACTVTGNITFNFVNARPGQHVYIFLDPTGAYTVNWGTGVYATGARQFKMQTGGYYQFHFEASSGGTLIQLGHHPSLATGSYVSPNPLMEWGADTTTPITLMDGDRRTANSASRIDYTLPSSPVYGTTVAIKGTNTGGFRIYLGNASHLIRRSQGSGVGVDVTTTGTSGYIGSTDGWDAITLMYVGSNTWSPITMIGGFNFV